MNLEITKCPCEMKGCNHVEVKGLAITGQGAIHREQAEFIVASVRLAERLANAVQVGASTSDPDTRTIYVDRATVEMAKEYLVSKKKAGLE